MGVESRWLQFGCLLCLSVVLFVPQIHCSDENGSKYTNKSKILAKKENIFDKKESTPKPPLPSSEATNSTTIASPSVILDQLHNLPHVVPTQTPHEATTSYYIEETTPVWPHEDLGPLTNFTLNFTQKEDSHRYYNSSFLIDPELGKLQWVDITKMHGVIAHDMLSHSHRRAATVTLPFEFPFYGHMIQNITIATGGFLYTGNYVHSWLAATQYIAPLMANFDTSLSNDSMIRYGDNGTAFVVQWDNVTLQDNTSVGNFTFQVTLHKTGDIVFAYKSIPLSITDIRDELHPVKVGLSDAYIIERTIFFMRRKTIYEYHRIDLKDGKVANHTAMVFKALPTCNTFNSCQTCLSKTTGFECQWCPSANRCSDGMDRNRQDWMLKGCERMVLIHEGDCANAAHEFPDMPPNIHDHGSDEMHSNEHGRNLPVVQSSISSETTTEVSYHHSEDEFIPITTSETQSDLSSDYLHHKMQEQDDLNNSGAGGMMGFVFIIASIVLLLGWLGYAYRYPHSSSGQLLIKYRPNQWRWTSRGEAAYTAASIHM